MHCVARWCIVSIQCVLGSWTRNGGAVQLMSCSIKSSPAAVTNSVCSIRIRPQAMVRWFIGRSSEAIIMQYNTLSILCRASLVYNVYWATLHQLLCRPKWKPLATKVGYCHFRVSSPNCALQLRLEILKMTIHGSLFGGWLLPGTVWCRHYHDCHVAVLLAGELHLQTWQQWS